MDLWNLVNAFAMSDASTIVIGFLVYFMDNILLTAVVPVIPDFLADEADRLTNGTQTAADRVKLQGSIGVLFASKSIVQLIFNPLAGYLAYRLGYKLLIYAGSSIYAMSSLMFATCESYAGLFAARSIHGIASAISIIAGLSLLASTYPDDKERSKAMGFALGGMAVGVLVGYPLGGFVYGFCTKLALFLLIFFAIVICGGVQYVLLRRRPEVITLSPAPMATVKTFLKDPYVILCLLSIGISTASIATLEPCLPIWLRKSIKPKEWQLALSTAAVLSNMDYHAVLGTAFLPDSLGYLIGTNLFGIVALKVGRWLCAFGSHVAISFSLFLIPFSTSMTHLLFPHFGVGLGIAVIDASLMPFLALIVERRGTDAVYTTIYALSQTAVCCAYALGPFIGAWLMAAIGFRGMLWGLATVNFLFSPITFCLRGSIPDEDEETEQQSILHNETSYRQMRVASYLDSD